MEKIITLDVDRFETQEEILQFLKVQNISKGDTLKVIVTFDEGGLRTESTVLLCLMEALQMLNEKEHKLSEQARIAFFDQQYNRGTLVKLLVDEYNVAVEVDSRGNDSLIDYENAPLLEPNALYRRSNQYN